MSALLNRLARDHRRLGRVMDLLEGLLDRFNAGDEPSYDLMCELMEYVVDYVDQVHHPAEDLILARLLARPALEPALPRQLTREHLVLGQIARRFRESLESIVHEAVLPREDVEQQGRELVAAMRAHMRLEDREVFPLAAATLTETDWAELQAQAPTPTDPVFGQADPLRFRALFDHLKDDLET